MSRKPGLVVIGGGQAGFQAAASARAMGYQERVTIVSGEAEPPYQRPPLSKAYLLGKQTRESLFLQKPSFYEDQGIELLLSRSVAQIDRQGSRVELDDGGYLPFTHLVLATGATNHTLPIQGTSLDGVLSLRSLGEADALRQRVEACQAIVVVGGGFIGLEFAAVARALGKSVTLVETQPRLMARAVPPAISAFYQREHEVRGVIFAMPAGVSRFDGEGGRLRRVVLRDGRMLEAELALVGVGVAPETRLAVAAGLSVGNGIEVDATLRTSDPRIFAIGDCASFLLTSGARRRVESVPNAVDQGRHLATCLVGGSASFSTLPWFWSDQYQYKLQIAGLAEGVEETVLRGCAEEARFSVFSYRAGRLVAVHSVNRPLDHAFARKLLGAGVSIPKHEATDETLDLRLIAQARSAAPGGIPST